MSERKQEWEEGTEWLHLYAQFHWHDEAHIAGTRKGIEALRDALTAALVNPDGVALASGFVNDGEGYFITVHVVPFAEMERLATPYADRELCGDQKGRMWPWQLPRQPKLAATEETPW
jgi:hypothetical protein